MANSTKLSVLRTIDLNLLRVLDALLSTQSVSKGAGKLGITQAAASNALHRLREHFGDELLVRSGQKMLPTALAEELAPRAAAAMALAASVLVPSAETFDPLRAQGHVRIATSDHVDALVVEPLSKVLATEAPGVTLFVEAFTRGAAERASEGEISLLMTPRSRMPEDLHAAHLFSEPYAVVLRKGHPAARSPLGPRELSELRHVVVSPGGGLSRTVVDTALQEHGLSREVVRSVPVFSQALLLVAESDLATTVPQSFAARFAARLGLVVFPLPVNVPPLRIDCGWGARVHNDPLHTWIRRRATQIAQSEIVRYRDTRAPA
jgi:DNA-binding transcriptional LysR family regulator